MTCSDIAKYVYVYLDGEFDANDQAHFEDHVGECAECQTLVRQERNFHQSLRAKLQIAPAPDYLRRRIEYQLSHTELEDSWRSQVQQWGIRLAPLALAAAILAVVVWPRSHAPGNPAEANSPAMAATVSTPVRATMPGMGTMTLASYSKLPADVQGNEPDITNYMRNRVSFQVLPPLTQTSELALVGARQVVYEGRDAVLLIYTYQAKRLGVIQYKGDTGKVEDLVLYRDGGMTFGQMSKHGMTYVLFSEMNANQLRALLTSR